MTTNSIRLDQELIERATIMAKAERDAGKLEAYDFG